MKKALLFLTAVITVLCVACASVPEESETSTDTEITETVAETGALTEEVTEPEEQTVLPDYYVDFSDEKNAYACSNFYNVTTEYTGDGIKVNFLSSGDGSDPTYCFDPYMTLPLPEGKISIDDYPYFVMFLYTSRDDMQGDIRYKTESVHNPASYPTYRFSYGGTGERKIILDLQESVVLFIAADDKPVEGNYTDLRMDMFENNANTTDTFIIHSYAFFKTEEEANAFEGIKSKKDEEAEKPDLSAYYKGVEFVTPDSKYKPKKLLYCFDNSYEFTVSKLKNNGYGGVVTNVRFALDYLQNDTEFEILKNAFEKSGDAGLHLWIYDEYQWPSGKAFGQVLKGHDEYEAAGIELIKLDGEGDINYTLPDNYIKIAGADIIKDGTKTPLETDGKRISAENGGKYTVYVYARRITNQKKEDPADFSTLRDVDLLNPDAVKRFLDLTYEKYKEKLGKTFDLVEAFFTDEPQLGNRDMKNYVVWTGKLPEKFREMHGYEIEENLYSLYDGDTDRDRLVRVNFYQTVSELFRVSYFEQIAKWCEENGVLSSGHLLFEENVQRQIETYGGDFLQLCGAMGIPGGDVLQIEPDRLLCKGTDIGNFMGLKYVYSAAKNQGKQKVHLEFTPSAVTGAPFFSEPGKYTIAGATLTSLFGANTYTVICGDGDIPTKDLQRFTDYVGRINVLLESAYTASEIGVFYPVDAIRAAYTATADHFDYNGPDEAAKINRLMQDTCYDILRAGYDFTVLDKQSVASSVVSGGKMKIGAGEYSVIVMPNVSVLSCDAYEKLLDFESSGGKIILLGCVPAMCDNINETERFNALKSKQDKSIYTGNIIDKIAEYCKIPMSARIKSGVFISEYKRTDDGKTVVYLANSTNSVKTVTLGDGCENYLIYDPYECTVTKASGQSTIRIEKYRAVLIIK
ncbi:MAG: hypothetical protein IJT49_03330 [Clostridia bacterium]|nr:hypothetical protein [Clostridia bacterium]